MPNCKLLLYADGAKLYLLMKDINDLLKLQQEIDNFLLWASVNGLSVNFDKCFFMSFLRGSVQSSSSYKIDDTDLEGDDSMRDLDVIVD